MSDRIAEIRARLDAATPGPWHKHDDEPWVTNSATPPMRIIATGLRGQPENADLIAHAPADIAWLLDEVERVTLERDIAKKWFHRWRRAAWEQSARKAAE